MGLVIVHVHMFCESSQAHSYQINLFFIKLDFLVSIVT